MKINKNIYLMSFLVAVSLPGSLSADNVVSSNSIDVESKPSSSYESFFSDAKVAKFIANVSVLINDPLVKFFLEEFKPDDYKSLQEFYEDWLIQSFAVGPEKEFEAYKALLKKLVPHCMFAPAKDRDESFIRKFIKYYSPEGKAFEALEPWQKDSYMGIVELQKGYDAQSEAVDS